MHAPNKKQAYILCYFPCIYYIRRNHIDKAMKRVLILILMTSPALLHAQTDISNKLTLGNVTAMLIIFFFFLLMVIALLLICREPICWYFKINKMIELQQEILELLKKKQQ